MWAEERAITPASDHLTRLVELNDGVGTSMEHKDVLACIYGDSTFFEGPACGQMRPVGIDSVTQLRPVWVAALSRGTSKIAASGTCPSES